MKKQFVPFYIALKVKKFGFDDECFCWYEYDESSKTYTLRSFKQTFRDDLEGWNYSQLDSDIFVDDLIAPTWQQVLQWLRDEHKIYIEILTDCTTEPKFCFKISKFVGNPKDLSEREWYWTQHDNVNWTLYYTYEEALECAIKEALDII